MRLLLLLTLTSCFDPLPCVEGEKKVFKITRCTEYSADGTACTKYNAHRETLICEDGEYK